MKFLLVLYHVIENIPLKQVGLNLSMVRLGMRVIKTVPKTVVSFV